MLTLKIALRNIFRHKARSIITLSTIVFGSAALIFIGGYFEDLFFQFREACISNNLGHIQIYRLGFAQHGKIDPYAYLIDNPQEIKDTVEKLPEVKFITSRLQFSGLMSTGETTVSFIGQGIEPQNEQVVPLEKTRNLRELAKSTELNLPLIVFGKGLEPDDVYQVILGKGLAQTIRAQTDSPLTLLTSTVHGATNALDVNVKGSFETAQKEFDDIFLRLPLKTAQSLLNTQSVQSLVIKLHKTDMTGRIFNELRQIIRDKKWQLELTRWEDLVDSYQKTHSLFKMFYWVMRIIIGTVVVLGIFNTMNMSVMERISEIGTLMALGVRRGGVMKLFLLEGLVLGFVGGVLGALAGTGIVAVTSYIGIEMPPPPGGTAHWLSTPMIVPPLIVGTFFSSIILSGVSSVLPAYKASRLIIVDALRYR